MIPKDRIYNVLADDFIPRHQIASRITQVERRLMEYFSEHKVLVVCVGNIGVGKSSLVKYLAYHTGMNALFELPDEGFEDHIPSAPALYPLLATAKDGAKRTLARYYNAINEFIEAHGKYPIEAPQWFTYKKGLERAALDIQHAYLDLRKMQLQALSHLKGSTCIDGSPLADRYAFCEVLHRDMDVEFLVAEGLRLIDERLRIDFQGLPRPDLLILLHGPVAQLLDNIRERERREEVVTEELPEGLVRLVKALEQRYQKIVEVLGETGWYQGPVIAIDVSKIDFVSNVRHLIACYEGIEKILVPQDFRPHR